MATERVTRELPSAGLSGLMPARGIQGRAGPGQTLMLRVQGRRVIEAMRTFDSDGEVAPVLDRVFLESRLPGLDRLADQVRHVVACVDGDTEMIVDHPGFRAAHEQLLVLRIGEVLANAAQPERRLRVERGSSALRRALDYVKEHADGSLDLAAMSRYAGVSLRSLQLMFRRDLDSTITEHIQRERLSRARERLEGAGPEHSVSEIARGCGFNHLGEFARLYARTFHELPSETLRRARQRD
jgi:AraC-like DNA-binding protein